MRVDHIEWLENSYWNNKGKYQNEYDEIMAAVDAGTFELTKATQKVFHSYYRFHNDGDTPTSYRYYAEKYQKIIEEKTSERILAEYKRFKKANKEDNTMAKEFTREEKLWTMTGTTLLGVAEKLGIKTSKSTLKQGKEKLIAQILKAEGELNTEADEDSLKPTTQAEPTVCTEPGVIEEPVEEESTEKPEVKHKGKDKPKEKLSNRANLKLKELTYKGKTQSIRAWAEELQMPWATLYDRVNRNRWSVEDAIETPLGQRRK